MALLADAQRLFLELRILFLPVRPAVGGADFDRRHFVFRAIGRPVGVLGGHHVGARVGEVERRVDDARLHAVRDVRLHGGFAGAGNHRHMIALADAAMFGVVGMDFQNVLGMPGDVSGAPGLRIFSPDPALMRSRLAAILL